MLTKKMQVDILAEMLEGLEAGSSVRVVDFDEPWRTVFQAIRKEPPAQRVTAMQAALRGAMDEANIIGELMKSTRLKSASIYRSLQDVADQLPPIRWCWQNWIPRGMISMLVAAPGTGKSLMVLDLARRVMTPNQTWPDGSLVLKNGPVIYIDAEGVPQLHNERARDWEMDTSRLYLMPDPLSAGLDTVDLTIDLWRDRLIEMTYVLKPEMIIIDSLGDVNSKGENNIEDIRELLNWLTRYTLDFQVAMVIIHHLRKKGSNAFMDLLSQDDVRGSGHIVAKARSLIGLSMIKTADSDEGDSDWRRLEILKTNLCRKPNVIGVELVSGLHSTPVLRYGQAPKVERAATKEELCQQWLLDLLSSGALSPKEIEEIGKAEGFSRTLIYNARSKLGKRIQNTAGVRSPDNMWEVSP